MLYKDHNKSKTYIKRGLLKWMGGKKSNILADDSGFNMDWKITEVGQFDHYE